MEEDEIFYEWEERVEEEDIEIEKYEFFYSETYYFE